MSHRLESLLNAEQRSQCAANDYNPPSITLAVATTNATIRATKQALMLLAAFTVCFALGVSYERAQQAPNIHHVQPEMQHLRLT